MSKNDPPPSPPYALEIQINAQDRESAIAGIRRLLDRMEMPDRLRLNAESGDADRQPGRAFGSGPIDRCYGYHIETYRRDVTPEDYEREAEEWFNSSKTKGGDA